MEEKRRKESIFCNSTKPLSGAIEEEYRWRYRLGVFLKKAELFYIDVSYLISYL